MNTYIPKSRPKTNKRRKLWMNRVTMARFIILGSTTHKPAATLTMSGLPKRKTNLPK